MGGQYWIVRNSWGGYWGEMGYVRVAFGALNVESQCSWAVVQSYTAAELNNQVHCHEGGDNCSKIASAIPPSGRRPGRRSRTSSRSATSSARTSGSSASSAFKHKTFIFLPPSLVILDLFVFARWDMDF